MAKILSSETWFEEVSPSSMYEADYERVILEHSNRIFPDFFLVPFKMTVTSDAGSAKADLALIGKTYLEWWVVEIEMGHHSFENHVLPQVSILANATYGEREALALCAASKLLDEQKMVPMLKGKQPSVLVVVNADKQTWRGSLGQVPAQLVVVEMYRSGHNEHVLRISGNVPAAAAVMRSRCAFENMVPRMLIVESPAVLDQNLKKYEIEFNGSVSEWQKIETKDGVWLLSVNKNPLDVHFRYNLFRTKDGSYYFEQLA